MKTVDTLIHARWLIPVEPEGLVLDHHALAVDAGNIVDVLPSDIASSRYHARDIASLPQHAVIPGFVNAHTHAAMTLFRGLADDLPLMEWLNRHIWPAETKWVGPEFVRDGVALAIAEMLRGGTTCFNDMYFFPDDAARVVRDSGMRACLGLILIDFPSAWASNSDEYITKGLKLHDDLRSGSLLSTAFAPHAPYTVSDGPLARIRTLAEELDLPVHIHVHETRDEVEQGEARHGMRPLARLQQLGLLSPHLLAVHMTQLLPAEIETLAESGAHVVHCPESNLKLGSGLCPVHRLVQAGVNVALGTDGAASNNDLDMMGEMRTAALLAKGVSGEATALPAPHALRMATLNGAKALGLDDRIGSLAIGKAADIAALDLSGIAMQPVYDPISQIVYAATRDQVTDVWVAGRRLLHTRRLTTIDEEALVRKAQTWRAKIAPYEG
jgi:5-methylthioadenosine/S-adenosylhomocysteine deaminase